MEFLAFLMGLGPSVELFRSQADAQSTALLDTLKNNIMAEPISKVKRNEWPRFLQPESTM